MINGPFGALCLGAGMGWLVVARHGAAESMASGGDAARPLTEAGRVQARQLGQSLKDRSLLPLDVWMSPFLRARETWDAMALQPFGGARLDAGLVPEASVTDLAAAVRAWAMAQGPEDGLLLVSHLPLVARLTWELGRQEVPFHTASASLLTWEGRGFRWLDHVQDGHWMTRG